MKPLSLAILAVLVGGTACVHTPRTARAVPPQPVLEPQADTDDDDGDNAEDATQATEFYLMRRVAPGETTLPLDRYITAREHSRRMPALSMAALARRTHPHLVGNSWTSLGPGNVGGRTRSLVINPQDPNIMYAGAVTGGVWKTTDGGANWTVLTDLLPVLNIGALVMDPNDPNTLYAGTGEYFASFPGQEIFKTTDGGATWNLLPRTGPTVTSSYQYVNRLVMSPTTPNRIYAATWSGVFTSADGGATWSNTGLSTTQAYNGCQDLVIRTDQATDYLFASCGGRGSSSAAYGIWRNTNAGGGGTWSQVFTTSFMARTSLAIAPSQQSTIYAMANNNGGNANYQNGLLGVYRSISNGDTGSWTTQVTNLDSNVTNTLLLTDTRTVTSSYCSGGALTYANGQGNYDNTLAVDPLDPSRVWAGGIDLFRSDDGGANWGVASLWQIAFGNVQFAHADRHLMVFHPGYNGTTNKTMYLATDGGLFRTDDARATVSTGPMGTCQANFTSNSAMRWVDLNNSYVATQYYHGAAYPGGQAYIGGAQDNTVNRGNDASGPNGFINFSTGDGTSVGVDPADVNRFFESKQNLSMSRSFNGLSVTSAIAGITEKPSGFPFVPFLAMDPNEGRRLFLGGTTNLWRSTDGAVSWTAAAPRVESGSSVKSIAVSPFDSNTVIFGTQLGYIYRSSAALASDGATTWASARPRTGSVASIAFDPQNPNIVYAVYSSLKSLTGDAHVYRSTDGGVTWMASDGAGAATLPDIPSFRLLVNPYNNLELFLGTDLGIYISENGGNTWSRDDSMSDVVVEDLVLDNGAQSNWLFAFTYGRGVFRVPLPGAAAPACNYTVSPTSINADAYGAVVPITVSAPPGCTWVGLPGTAPTQFYIQSPAQGSGSGTAFVVIEPNIGANTLNDKVTIANTVIPISQTAGTLRTTSSDVASGPTVLNVPGEASVDTRKLTSSPDDPVQSCTGTQGNKSAWWVVTAASNEYLQARAYGRRYDVFGNSGIVITAYPQTDLSNELACAMVPRDTFGEVDAVIQFPVTAGASYLVEITATGSTANDGGSTVLAVTPGPAPSGIVVSPSTATLTAGFGRTQQFSVNVSNAANSAVRWTLTPPVGVISNSGVYTAPLSVDSPTTVQITATSFADPNKQSSATMSLLPFSGAAPAVSLIATNNAQSLAISQNTWIEIKGVNLAPGTGTWQDADFVNNQLPTQLDGVSVTVGGKPAFVYYISPTQVNVLTPLGLAAGDVQVILKNSGGTALPMVAHVQTLSPEFFAINGGPYVVATHVSGAYIGPASLFPGATTPAVRNEVVVIYANGFGQTNPSVVNGAVGQSGALPVFPTVTIGGITASVQYAGVISPGLYQFNVVIPPTAPHGDNLLVATYNGYSTQSNLMITVQ